MSAEYRQLRFSVTVEDHEHWLVEHIDAANEDNRSASYSDWVIDQLEGVMREAANQFIKVNEDLFRSCEII